MYGVTGHRILSQGSALKSIKNRKMCKENKKEHKYKVNSTLFFLPCCELAMTYAKTNAVSSQEA